MENTDFSQLGSISREIYYDIWQRVNAGEKLWGEEKIVGELMLQHKEYYDEWNSTDFDYEYDPDTEVNPFLHIAIDTIVKNQITQNDPPQTKLTYERLVNKGNSHLEAIHKIASVIVEEIWHIIKKKECSMRKVTLPN